MTRSFLAAAAAALALGACTSKPVLNIDDSPVPASFTQDVGPVIERALAARGWRVTARRPGSIDADIDVRVHKAAITIDYGRTSYDIRYRDSTNLEYKPKKGKIHRNYNRWIANLDRDIQSAVGAAPAAP